MTAPYIFPAVSERGLGQVQGSAAFLVAIANICIGEILMVSAKQRQAAVPAQAAATCGRGNMADPLIVLVSDFSVRCCHLFHFKSFMQEHLILCDDKAVRRPETCCPEASWLEENPLWPNNWLKLVFTEGCGKFAMTSTEAKPAEVHMHLLRSVVSPQQLYLHYIHAHAAIRSTSDPHIAQSPESLIFWV